MRAPLIWASEGNEPLDLSNTHIGIREDDSDLTPRPRSDSHPSRNKKRRTFGECIVCLPPEILSEIFAWCTPSSVDQEGYQPRFALTLSHVSSYWRIVALNSPRLWTYTKVTVFEQYLPPALKLMELYLDRSGACPIFIDVDFVDAWSVYKHALGLFEQVVETARMHRPVQAVADSFVATHVESTSSEVRPIREEWYFWSGRPKPTTPYISDCSDSSLQLANTRSSPPPMEPSVTIRALRLAIGSFIVEPYLPLAPSLTFLIIDDKNGFTDLTTTEALRILHAFPLLVHCSLRIDVAQVAVPLSGTPVELKFLKSFSLSWADWMDVGPLMDMMITPNLKELELSGLLPENGRPEGWDHVEKFLVRSKPPLTHVIFEHIDCFYISLLDCLTFMPALEGLWLENCIIDDSIIRGLYSPPIPGSQGPGHCILTRLETLVLLSCYQFSFDTLLTALKAASDDVGRFDTLKVRTYVNDCGEVTKEHLAELQRLGLTCIELGPDSVPPAEM